MIKLRIAVLFLAVVVITGIAGYRFLEGYTWFEAFYMTIITISTVGFQEVRPLSSTGRLFTIGLLFAGLGVVLYTAGTVTAKIVEGEFQQFFGRRRMEKQIDALTNHYLVCGYGRIGEVICRELASKPVPFVVIELEEERVRRVEEAGHLLLKGDATDEKVLLVAGVIRAKGLFATMPVDADNVFMVLTAKDLNPSIFVVARAETERSEKTLVHAGADKVISPYAMGGHRMAQAALRPAVVDIIELATHYQSLELQLEEIVVPPGSPCEGVTLRDSGLRQEPGVIVVAIKRALGGMIFNPSADEKIEAGDSLVALGEVARLRWLERRVELTSST
ncbi:potassium channel protein [Candidatus Methylomirabilis limnetica]|uniref:Potassium channel protein n=1 Tax=Candidatus Methylomirabilis limnetica TaxID=2033718 RepID=A0A2T4TY64_9BACT|nr:potassium channel protein [Candidatus Methylomirabilis limnetica]PTL36054.1 potassium channel protein [Candidatus Methylomirabilis limnetica]